MLHIDDDDDDVDHLWLKYYSLETLADKMMLMTMEVAVVLHLMVAYFHPCHWSIVDVAVDLLLYLHDDILLDD